MEKQIEVEFIGDIKKEQFDNLKVFFKKEGTYKKTKHRISFMYFKDKIPKDMSEIKLEDIDLRLRITNKKPELVLKQGLFTGAHARKEISINLSLEEFPVYIELLKALGWHLGVIYAVETLVYNYKNIEFSLVNIKDYGYNFEAEILTDEKEQAEAKKKIMGVLDQLKLKPFDEAGLNKQCNDINNRKELQFDFSKQSFDTIKNKFKEYFEE